MLDDLAKIQENPDLRVTEFSLQNFIFSYSHDRTFLRNDPSRPLVYIVYWMAIQSTTEPHRAIHTLSTTLHAGVASLVALLALWLYANLGLGVQTVGAFVAALLFLSAPVVAGTVLYAFALSDILTTFFVLLTLLLLLQNRRSTTVAACLTYVLALTAKQSAVIVLPLLVLCDLIRTERLTRWQRVQLYAPVLSITAIYLVCRFLLFGELGDLEGKGSTFPALAYLSAQGLMILKYFGLIFWPQGMSIDHYIVPTELSPIARSLAWVAVVTLTLLAVLNVRARLSWAWLFFLLCLLPTSSVFPTVDLFVERRSYLATAPIFIGLVGLFLDCRSAAVRAFSLLLTALAVATQFYLSSQRTQVYASTPLLWQESIANDSRNLRAKFNLITHYFVKKEYAAAQTMLEDLVKLEVARAAVQSKLGFLYMQADFSGYDQTKALEYLQASLQTDANNIFARYNAGSLLLAANRFVEAERMFQRVVELNPLMDLGYVGLGEAALGQGQREKARAHFLRALELNRDQVAAQRHLRDL